MEPQVEPPRRRRAKTCAFCKKPGKYEGSTTGLLYCDWHLMRYYLSLGEKGVRA